jgi:hypothetical protein
MEKGSCMIYSYCKKNILRKEEKRWRVVGSCLCFVQNVLVFGESDNIPFDENSKSLYYVYFSLIVQGKIKITKPKK